jgi:ketosteroid isomerase-like protein
LSRYNESHEVDGFHEARKLARELADVCQEPPAGYWAAMSEKSPTPDLVELVRRRSEASNRRDMDALMSLFAQDGVYDTSPSGLGVYEGQAAIRAFIGEWWDSFQELHFEPEEIVNLGGGVTFSVVHQDARPAGSAGHVRTREAHVIEWVGGAATRVTVYQNIDEARAAAERLAESRG